MPLTRDRVGGSSFAARALLSIIGGIQPAPMSEFFSNPKNIHNGLMPRFLIHAPPYTPSGWSDVERDPKKIDPMYDIVNRLLDECDRWFVTGGPPKVVKMSQDAQDAFQVWHEEHEFNTPTDDAALRAAWQKMKGQCARFALNLFLIGEVAEKSWPSQFRH